MCNSEAGVRHSGLLCAEVREKWRDVLEREIDRVGGGGGEREEERERERERERVAQE